MRYAKPIDLTGVIIPANRVRVKTRKGGCDGSRAQEPDEANLTSGSGVAQGEAIPPATITLCGALVYLLRFTLRLRSNFILSLLVVLIGDFAFFRNLAFFSSFFRED